MVGLSRWRTATLAYCAGAYDDSTGWHMRVVDALGADLGERG